VGLAALGESEGRRHQAARHQAVALGLKDRHGFRLGPDEENALPAGMAGARKVLGEQEFEALRTAGGALPLEAAIARALQVPGQELPGQVTADPRTDAMPPSPAAEEP
jgi:hypothetical protein